jgi:hypothetical protein
MESYKKVSWGLRQVSDTGIGDIQINKLKVKIATKPFHTEEHSFKNVKDRNKFIKDTMKKYSHVRRHTDPYTCMM